MKKREKIIVLTALIAAIAIIILGIIASFFIQKPSFDSITGRVVYSCSNSIYPQCGGDCPPGMLCLPDAQFGGCVCAPSTKSQVYCSDSEYPLCEGYCTLGLECQPDLSSGTCQCSAITSTGKRVSVSCTPNFKCSEWSECKGGEQVRVCIDSSGCVSNKQEKRACTSETPVTISCIPNWQCLDWSECNDNEQTRKCTDINNCNTQENKPAETKKCVLAPTGKTTARLEDKTITKEPNTLEKVFEIILLQKTGFIILLIAVSVVISAVFLFIKKQKKAEKQIIEEKQEITKKEAIPKPKTTKKLNPKIIYLLTVILIIGLVYFSYNYYEEHPQTRIIPKAISIDKIIPPIDQHITNNMFINIFKNLPPLKKAGVAIILIIISTLILILALVLTKKK